jgi:hypothetical protein
MVKGIELSNARRLSIYIREEHPELLQEISEKIVNKLIVRLGLNQRDLQDVKTVWIFSVMFCVVTRDLWLFNRMYKDADHARILFGYSLSYISNIQRDSVINSVMAKQLTNYFEYNKENLTVFNAIVAQTIVESWVLHEQFLASIDSIVGLYINKEIQNG